MEITIKVLEMIGQYAVSAEDGQKLHNRILDGIHGPRLRVDFAGVRVVSTPFLNSSVGRLLKDISADELQQQISFEGLSPVGTKTLSMVIENARQYYHQPGAREQLDKILLESGDDQ